MIIAMTVVISVLYVLGAFAMVAHVRSLPREYNSGTELLCGVFWPFVALCSCILVLIYTFVAKEE